MMEHPARSRQSRICILFALSTLFFAFIMQCAPMASDDLEFASLHFPRFSDALRYALYYGNGRVLGNLGVVNLVHMPAVTICLKAFMISGIIFLVPAVLGIDKPVVYLMSFLLFVLIPPALFGEVYVWTSGFQNYIPPVWITLIVLYLIKGYDSLRAQWLKIVCCVAIFLLGFAGQLYVEHATVHNLILAGSTVFYLRRSGRSIKPSIVWLLAVIAGAACMVLTPIVFYEENNRTGSYRSVDLDGITQLIVSCKNSFISIVTAFPCVGTMVVSGFALYTTWVTRNSRSKKGNRILYDIGLLGGVYITLNKMLRCDIWHGRWAVLKYLVTGIMTVSPFIVWTIALYRLDDSKLRNRIYAMLFLAILAAAPLLVVSPTPDRVIYLPYVCTVCAMLLFFDYLPTHMECKTSAVFNRAVKYISVVTAMILCMTFTNIKWLDRIREEHIQNEMAAHKTEITIFRIPYDYAFWDGAGFYGRHYFYEGWYDIHFKEVEFSEW